MAITPIDDSDPVAPLENLFNTQAAQLEAEIASGNAVRQIQTYKWANAAARAAQTGMTEGDIGDQADTDKRYRYTGTAWLDITTGLVPITPASATGTGVVMNTMGRINFTAATSIIVNGCFTSAYDNYVVKFNNTAASAAVVSIDIQLRVGGVNTATGYDRVSLYGQNGVAGSATAVNQTAASIAAGNLNTFNLELVQPANTVPTMMSGSAFSTPNPGTAAATAFSQVGILQRASTAFDGFSLSITGGNATGVLRIYGYNNM